MIEYSSTTVFNTTMQTIVNTINCVGIMGRGLALDFRLRYPGMYEDYRIRCNEKKVNIGIPYVYNGYDPLLILNFPTKLDWKHQSKIEWIEKGLIYFVNNYEKEKILSIAFPKLGTNSGGLRWNDVKSLMENYLNKIKIPVQICLNEEENATGTEGKMVEIINKMTEDELVNKGGLVKRTAKVVCNNKPYRRFYEINKTKQVSMHAYEKIYIFCYKRIEDQKYWITGDVSPKGTMCATSM